MRNCLRKTPRTAVVPADAGSGSLFGGETMPCAAVLGRSGGVRGGVRVLIRCCRMPRARGGESRVGGVGQAAMPGGPCCRATSWCQACSARAFIAIAANTMRTSCRSTRRDIPICRAPFWMCGVPSRRHVDTSTRIAGGNATLRASQRGGSPVRRLLAAVHAAALAVSAIVFPTADTSAGTAQRRPSG